MASDVNQTIRSNHIRYMFGTYAVQLQFWHVFRDLMYMWIK